MGKKKYWSIITISLTIVVCFLFCGQILFADSITPGTVSATLDEGDFILETKTVTLEGAPADVDILFSFDLTGSMGGIINAAKAKANEIMTAIQAALPSSSIRFGVASYMDYPGCYDSCGYGACYGYASSGDYPYRLDQSLTSNTTAVSTAINGLTLGYGGDGPQDYTRVFYESYADSSIGWGEGVKILINFGDNVPHDCNLNEGVTTGTWTTGGDPGRDGIMGTGDDLDLQTVLANMAANKIILMELHTTFASYTPKAYWDYWTGITGGSALLTSSSGSDLVDQIVAAVNEAVRQIDTLTLSASAGYGDWLCSVSPSSYNNINVPEGGQSFNFDISICVPDYIECGIHNFTINAVGDGQVFASQHVIIDVPCNSPPVPDADGPYTGYEGSSIAFDGSGSYDPDGDIIEYRWDFDNDGIFDTDWSSSPYAENTWCDDFSGTAVLEVRDAEFVVPDTAPVTVYNVPPELGPITVTSPDPIDEDAFGIIVAVNTPVTASANFTDDGTCDTHEGIWDWDAEDGEVLVTSGVVSEIDGSGTVEGTYSYDTPGVYTIELTLWDDDDGVATAIYMYVVVVDPDDGFVTGGGYIYSEAGSYAPDPDLEGPANFGFVSKYKRGATTPMGQTEFNFRVAGLNFHSSSYQWLVVAGPNAKFKGWGTINGEEGYGFILTAQDAQLVGTGDGTDKFRIKIWWIDPVTEAEVIVYDNEMGAPDDEEASTEIEGGSIVIHLK